jgi:Zn-dependent protease with chaperone function
VTATAGTGDPRIDGLIDLARRSPAAYERRVVMLAILGYAYLVAALLVIVALMAGLGVFLFGWQQAGHPVGLFAGVWIALITLGFAVLNAFTFTAPAPKGIPLHREDAPELFALIEDLRAGLAAPSVDEVLLTWGADAACQQRVRFGPFGPTRRSVLVGLPALLAITAEELRAILAHELGHFSTSSGRAGAWVYGVRETWSRLVVDLHERRSLTKGVFTALFGWYMSYFGRYSFVLARQQEASADRAAAALSGGVVLADALVRLTILRQALSRQTGLAFGMASLSGLAPVAQARAFIRGALDPRQSQRDLMAAIAAEEELADVHPPLRTRLVALGVEPRAPAPAAKPAADRYLAARLDEFSARVDELWEHESPAATTLRDIAKGLRQQVVTATDELTRLEKIANTDATDDDLRRRAEVTEWLRGSLAALPVYETLAQRENPAGLAGAGRIHLATGDAAGLELIDRAVALDRSIGAAVANDARDFLVAEGRTEEAAHYEELIEERATEQMAVHTARAALSVDDEIVAHDLGPELVAKVAAIFPRVTCVSRAQLVKKIVRDRPEVRAYFLAVTYETGWFIRTDQKDQQIMTSRIQEAVEAIAPDLSIVPVNAYAGRKKLLDLEGSLVYARPPQSLPREILPRWGARGQTIVTVLAFLYTLMYAYFVANLKAGLNVIAAPLVLLPLVVIVFALLWARGVDSASRRTAALGAVGALIGMVIGAFVTEGEWTLALVPLAALGLLRPPADAPRTRAALIVGAAVLGGLALRLIAHIVLVG